MHDYYAVYPGMADQLVTDPSGPSSGDHHVVRGSGWRAAAMTSNAMAVLGFVVMILW